MTSVFTGNLTITELDVNWRQWRLEQPLAYDIGSLGSGKTIIVPEGFVTDGASIPRILWSILPTWGTYSRAAVIHDYLCNCIEAEQPNPFAPDWKTAAAIFYEAMVVCGTGMTMRWVMWAAVRLYGLFRQYR